MSTSRFDRPTYASRATQPIVTPSYYDTVCTGLQAPCNATGVIHPASVRGMKTVAERQKLKPFGKAVDTEQNKNITTYGEDVFIEYNPMVFLGKKGIARADAYLKNVINACEKNEPVTDIIMLKLDSTDNTGCTGNVTCRNNWDWWGDDNINDKINAYDVDNNLSNALNRNNKKISVTTLIPDVIDKINMANKLIREMASFNPKTHDTIKFRTLQTSTARSTASIARFEPVRRNIDTNTDKPNHANFDDNFSIRISNFSNPDVLTTYAIKDALYEYMGNIPFKVSIPRNKETNKNKDFAFINFVSEDDLNNAFEKLSKQRIFIDSAILYIEVSKRRNGY